MINEEPIRRIPEEDLSHSQLPSSDLNLVNMRRYLVSLEHSLNEGTQWAVFEPNGEALWARVRTTVSDLLTKEWQSGKLLGTSQQEAFFVHCDRTTMTQNDLDNGRLICVIGVAPTKPAEFVIINIGQWTTDHKP